MKTSCQILPGVRAIYWLDCEKLPSRTDLRGICRMTVPILTDCNELSIAPDCECSCKSQREGRGFQDTASISFIADELVPMHIHAGFVVEDVEGNTFLIGSKEPPFPQIKVERKTGSPSGKSAGFAYDVTHVALKSLVPCHISV